MGKNRVKKTRGHAPAHPALSLSLSRDRAVVSSLRVAEHFDKEHYNVLRDIKALLADLPEEHRLNFEGVEYLDAKGERRPAYNLTRDGFTLLAMGFTGKRALAWKVRYIDAFNLMEAELLRLREAGRRLPSTADIRAAADYHMVQLGRSVMQPDHPLADTWRREAYEFLNAISPLK
jgi:Rha family phage regulatory protein